MQVLVKYEGTNVSLDFQHAKEERDFAVPFVQIWIGNDEFYWTCIHGRLDGEAFHEAHGTHGEAGEDRLLVKVTWKSVSKTSFLIKTNKMNPWFERTEKWMCVSIWHEIPGHPKSRCLYGATKWKIGNSGTYEFSNHLKNGEHMGLPRGEYETCNDEAARFRELCPAASIFEAEKDIQQYFGQYPFFAYYYDDQDHILFQESFVEASLDKVRKMHVEGNKMTNIEFIGKHSDWALFALTFFINSQNYIGDMLYSLKDGKPYRTEFFNGEGIGIVGAYDCEDGSKFVACLVRYLQRYPGANEACLAYKDLLSNYWVANVLIMAQKSTLYPEPDPSSPPFDRSALIPHVTCILIHRENKSIRFLESTTNVFPDPMCVSLGNGFAKVWYRMRSTFSQAIQESNGRPVVWTFIPTVGCFSETKKYFCSNMYENVLLVVIPELKHEGFLKPKKDQLTLYEGDPLFGTWKLDVDGDFEKCFKEEDAALFNDFKNNDTFRRIQSLQPPPYVFTGFDVKENRTGLNISVEIEDGNNILNLSYCLSNNVM